MEFDLPRAGGILAVIIVLGVGGLAVSDVMVLQTVLMMVLPSMVIFDARTDVVFLDEPTAGLDPRAAGQFERRSLT